MALKRIIGFIHGFMEREVYNTLGLYRNHAKDEYELRLDVVVIFVMLAALLRVALEPFFGSGEQFSVFFLAVIASAWLAGFWAGLTAALLSAATALYFTVEKLDMGVAAPPTQLLQAVFFIVGSAVMSFLITSLTRARLKTTEVANELLKEREGLAEANRKIKNILESISDGFAAVDNEGRLTYANKKMELFLGKKREDVVGKAVGEVFDLANFAPYFEHYREAKRSKSAQSFEYYSAALHSWFLVHIYPARNGASFYLTEITERKNQEQRKDEFVSVASHELKTPVTSVKLFAEILRKRFETTGDKESAGYISRIYEQLEKLTKLIQTLLDVSALQEGKMHFETQPLDLRALVEEVRRDLQVVASRHRIETHISESVTVMGDKDRLQQVLTNLVNNGIKYSPDADRVVVSLKEERNRAVISVRDFGIGISNAQKEKIFDRYFQGTAEGQNSLAYQGLGLGLYIVREIVAKHRGKIWVESTLGQGSTFFVSLPTAPPQPL